MVGGTRGEKNKVRNYGRAANVFFIHCTTGAANGTLVRERKNGIALFFFFCLLVMLLCSIKAPLPQHVAFPRRLLLYQLGSCDPCVVRWSLLQPLLCRLQETTTTFVVLRKGRSLPEHIFFADLFFFFFFLRCTTGCRLGVHIYIHSLFMCAYLCVR